MNTLPKEEATDFFAELFRGEHHIPGRQLLDWGEGWAVECRTDLSTFDGSLLTRLVVLAHDRCCRAEISPSKNEGLIYLAIHKREREGPIDCRHPTLEEHIQYIRSNPYKK